MTIVNAAAMAIPGFAEKAPLERYVVPAKPTLVGMPRQALAAALGDDRRRAGRARDARAPALALALCARRDRALPT